MSTLLDEDEPESTKDTEEQFLLEPVQAKNGERYVMVNTRLDYQHRSNDLASTCLYDFVSHLHKETIDKSNRRLLNNASDHDGKQLDTDGTKMSERHTFSSAYSQSSSHIVIKRTIPVVSVLLGPQIPRRDREEIHERYCRAFLTLFVPWRLVSDICAPNETWSQAFEVWKSLISSSSLKIIENIQLLHECKHDRDENLRQVLLEAQNENNIDPILIADYHEQGQNIEEDDPEQLLQMLSIVNETTINAYFASIDNQEQRYLNDSLKAIDGTDRFALLTRELSEVTPFVFTHSYLI